MFSMMVAMMLMAAKDPLEAPRKAYSNCLIELHNEAIKSKKTVEEFKAIAEAGCETEKKAFHDAVFQGERKYSNANDAEEYAAGEVSGQVDWIVETFEGNHEDGGTISRD